MGGSKSVGCIQSKTITTANSRAVPAPAADPMSIILGGARF